MAMTSTNATKMPPLDAAAPSHTEIATFALGYFWSPDARFGVTPSVVRIASVMRAAASEAPAITT